MIQFFLDVWYLALLFMHIGGGVSNICALRVYVLIRRSSVEGFVLEY